jgi:RNA polymerase sigma-70 factor (ECF subfamily)
VEYSNLRDDALIQLVVLARAEALSELYDRYGRLIYSVARNIVEDGPIAEEITQEVFLQVWQNAGSYRSYKGKLVTWMTTITRYRAIDSLRRRKARPQMNPLFQVEHDSTDLPAEYGLEEEVDLTLLSQRVHQAVAALPVDQRTALALAFFHGLTHREIAGRLDIPLGTVKTRIRLAMQKLRLTLHEERIQEDG